MSQLVCPICGKRYPLGQRICQEDGKLLVVVTEDPLIHYQVDKYKLLKRIGKGGFGFVYLAEHSGLGTQFAIKILKKQFLDDEQLVNRFLLEASLSSQINHENIVHIVDYGKDAEIGYYYVMEYLEGLSLTELMASYPNGMPIERILPILRYISGALDKAHHHGIIHRDLKPSNIFLIKRYEQEDVVKILDFGIAKVIENKEGMTVTGQIVGSPRFMSPEQARGEHDAVDARSDIYSLGIILFWMLTGKLPFDGKRLAKLLMMHIKEEAPLLSDVAPEKKFGNELERLIASTLAKEKDQRPHSAGQLYRHFEASAHVNAWEDTEFQERPSKHVLLQNLEKSSSFEEPEDMESTLLSSIRTPSGSFPREQEWMENTLAGVVENQPSSPLFQGDVTLAPPVSAFYKDASGERFVEHKAQQLFESIPSQEELQGAFPYEKTQENKRLPLVEGQKKYKVVLFVTTVLFFLLVLFYFVLRNF